MGFDKMADAPVASWRQTDDPPDLILVRDFVGAAFIGIYPHERQRAQTVRVNVAVEIDPRAAEPSSIDDTLSYDLITGGIRAILDAEHIELVENLAERIAAHVLSFDTSLRTTVRVEKLDIIPGGAVGVEICRRKPPAI